MCLAIPGKIETIVDADNNTLNRRGKINFSGVFKEVSLAYVYRLLRRHQWRKLGPRPRHVKADPEAQEAFKKNSRSSSRKS